MVGWGGNVCLLVLLVGGFGKPKFKSWELPIIRVISLSVLKGVSLYIILINHHGKAIR